jgi:hypothetical protein
MPIPQTYSFTRYLSAKKSVDDRALNRHVWQTLAQYLPKGSPDAPVKILEAGAGIGTMIERMLEWELLDYAEYTALDSQSENIHHALKRLPDWACRRGYQVETISVNYLTLKRGAKQISVKFHIIDLFDFINLYHNQQRWDLLVAHAFLDLVNIPRSLPLFFQLCKKNGLFYFSLNFDGMTILEPIIDPVLDEHIQQLYHRTMDERIINGQPSGDSCTGRHLFKNLTNAGAHILDAGASDWIVFPSKHGYPQDEAYFLHFIINTIRNALSDHPELDAARFSEWIDRRHAQVELSQLTYIAHQLDFVGRNGKNSPP